MNKTKVVLSSLLLLSVLIGGVIAATYWMGSLQWGINVTGTEALLIDLSSPDNYLSQTEALTISSSADARLNTAVLTVLGSNVVGDQVLRINIDGVPDGLEVSAKMGFVSYFERYFVSPPFETNIGVFNDAGVHQPFCGIGEVYESSVDWSTMRDLQVSVNGANPEYGNTLSAADLDHITYNDVFASYNTVEEPVLDDANGMILHFEFNSAEFSGYGDFDLTITITLTDA